RHHGTLLTLVRDDTDAEAPAEVAVERAQLSLVQVEGKDAAHLQQVHHAGHGVATFADVREECGVHPRVAVARIPQGDDEDVRIDEDHGRRRDRSIARRQLASGGAVARRAASISRHASSYGRSSGSSGATLAGAITARGRRRRVTSTRWPRATARRASPVRFFSSLAVIVSVAGVAISR